MNKQSYFTEISEIQPHPNADKLELAKVRGWQSVVPKGAYKAGDWVLFVEIDSILPRYDWNAFLFKGSHAEDETIRIKNAKLRGQPSQGVCFPMNDVCGTKERELIDKAEVSFDEVDTDSLFNITHYVKPIPAQLAGIAKGNFPTKYGHKTDEDNLLSTPELLDELGDWTELDIFTKLDGSSATYIFDTEGIIHVCSRNLELEYAEGNTFWAMVEKYNLGAKLKHQQESLESISGEVVPILIQGELCGPSIQKNPMGLDEHQLFVFNVKVGGEYQTYDASKHNPILDIPVVPYVQKYVIKTGQSKDKIISELQEIANNLKYDNGNPAEGIVIRPLVPVHSNTLGKNWSAKIINQNYKD